MSEPVFTLAIWHVEEGRWIAGLTSPVRSRVEAVWDVCSRVVPAFFWLVEVPRDDVELIETMVAALPPVNAVSVFCLHHELMLLVQEEALRIARAAQPLATGKASLN